MAIATKQTRIEFRLNEESKKMIEEAANLSNLNISSYILNVIIRQAKIDLEQNEIIKLDNSDRDRLLKALSQNKEPNDKLRGLFK